MPRGEFGKRDFGQLVGLGVVLDRGLVEDEWVVLMEKWRRGVVGVIVLRPVGVEG